MAQFPDVGIATISYYRKLSQTWQQFVEPRHITKLDKSLILAKCDQFLLSDGSLHLDEDHSRILVKLNVDMEEINKKKKSL